MGKWWAKRKIKMTRWWWVTQMGLVFITVAMILQFQMKGCVGCVETERMGLLQLKSYLNSLLGPQEEIILKSWTHDGDCCRWKRVKCIGGHIVHLSLDQIMPDADLNRDPPRPLNISLLHSFPKLKTLDLSSNWFNQLFDPIHGHKSFHRLENLENLNLSNNDLNKRVLPYLSSARSLRNLNLGYNRLKGVFPPNELANIPELRVLNLQWNGFNFFSVQGLINFRELEVLDLSGTSINDFKAGDGGLKRTKLKTLDLSYNVFSDTARLKGLQHLVELKVLRLMWTRFHHTGFIQVLKDMPKLQELDLTGNEFTDLDSLGVVFPSSLQVLNLKDNQLSLTHEGYSKICGLVNLQELDLSSNALTSMPNCLGNLTRLRTLDLSNTLLSGNLSSFVSGLPSALEYLSLLHTNFIGSFLFNSLANQRRLTVFKLSSNVGMIQALTESSWVPLFQLKILKLQNFILGSTIPGFLVHQHDLCFIDISYSQLTGAFPTWLVQNNTRLQTILLNSNSLSELQLPKLLVHGLQVVDISSNKIYNSIQEEIGFVFPNLRYMNFSSNHFHGAIPSSMGEMKSLLMLDMSFNGLSGQLPKRFLSGCYSLKFLKLSNNQLQGNIFPENANLTGLAWLALDGNNFSGSLGKGLLNSKNLTLLDISDNSFSGTLPLWFGRMSSLSYLYIRGNQLKGHFPHRLQNLELKVIDISDNNFYGSIPRNVDFPFLRELRLQGNEFMGSIPDILFKAEELEVLDLRNNKFSGMILSTIGKRSNLGVFLLRNNSFQTHIPKEICELSHVGLLDLSHNKFKGSIPSCFSKMSFGDVDMSPVYLEADYYFVDITLSQHCGYESIFTDLNDDLRNGAQANGAQSNPTVTVDFLTKKRYEAYQGDILRYMYGLDLSSNQLSGEIPIEIGNLENIRSLNLSSNCLTGSIPSSISKLEDLESLDLSNNKLGGNIPPQLADLNSLGYLNVSCNNLSGEIPFKGHLVTFEEMSYIGNAHLCGLPTNKSCRVSEPSASNEEEEEEEEEEEGEGDGVIDMVWFYWTCGAVYIATASALFVFLCIDSRWSREWFYLVDLLVHHLQRFKGHSVCN